MLSDKFKGRKVAPHLGTKQSERLALGMALHSECCIGFQQARCGHHRKILDCISEEGLFLKEQLGIQMTLEGGQASRNQTSSWRNQKRPDGSDNTLIIDTTFQHIMSITPIPDSSSY